MSKRNIPRSTVTSIEEAAALHRSGKGAEAEAIYKAILADTPNHPDALHLLGVYHCQKKDYASALPYLNRAVTHAPHFEDAHVHLAKALRRLGRSDEAISLLAAFLESHRESNELLLELARAQHTDGNTQAAESTYRKLLKATPGYFPAHAGLAETLRQQGKRESAAHHYRQALMLRPNDVASLNGLATLEKELGKTEDAVALLQKAISCQHDFAAGHNNLGNLLLETGRGDEAIAAYRAAINHQTVFPEAWNNLGNALKENGRLEEAIEAYGESLRQHPDYAEAMSNLGNALLEAERYDEAIRLHEQALTAKPEFSEAWNNLANVQMATGKPHTALTSFEKAVSCDPASHQARFGRGLANLMLGNFPDGWEDYEHRWWGSHMARKISPPKFPFPQWNGSSPRSGAHILVYHEQGFGDTIQFSRYLPLLANRFGKVTCVCQDELQTLFVASFGSIARIIPAAGSAAVLRESFDWHSPLLSLPRAFRTNADTIPSTCPYLAPPATALTNWRPQIGAQRLRVGLCWKGNPELRDDKRRSLPDSALKELSGIGGIHWYNLARSAAGEKHALTSMTDPMENIRDFGETAAVIACLDLVITVDTAVAHLAGALGKPVWLLCRHASEWRWQWERTDSPWYPSMRIFRQSCINDWASVLAAITSELMQLTGDAGKSHG